jgi:hypothetical protein
MPWGNSLAHASRERMPSMRGWKPEMRTSATVKGRAFPAELMKEGVSRSETAKDSASGSEWGKG